MGGENYFQIENYRCLLLPVAGPVVDLGDPMYSDHCLPPQALVLKIKSKYSKWAILEELPGKAWALVVTQVHVYHASLRFSTSEYKRALC